MKGVSYMLTLLALLLCSTSAAAQGGGGEAITVEAKPALKSPGAASRRKSTAMPVNPASVAAASAGLTINAHQAGATVLINGKSRGSTNSYGLLNITSLKPGRYVVIVSKQNYGKQQRIINLLPGQNSSVEFPLRGAPGRLTIKTGIGNAEIEIIGVGRYSGYVSNLALQPGNYAVRVSLPGCAETRNVTITPSASLSISVVSCARWVIDAGRQP